MLTKQNIRDKVKRWKEFNAAQKAKPGLTMKQKGEIVQAIMDDYASRTPVKAELYDKTPKELVTADVGRRRDVLWGIEMVRVNSAFIHSIGYSTEYRKLKLVIRDTTQEDPKIYAYVYSDISNNLWKRFYYAKDYGKFYNKNIKGKYTAIALV